VLEFPEEPFLRISIGHGLADFVIIRSLSAGRIRYRLPAPDFTVPFGRKRKDAGKGDRRRELSRKKGKKARRERERREKEEGRREKQKRKKTERAEKRRKGGKTKGKGKWGEFLLFSR